MAKANQYTRVKHVSMTCSGVCMGGQKVKRDA